MRYAIVIEKAAANYAAYGPDLPGCVATGVSVAQTESLIREAIEFHLDGIKHGDGKAIDCDPPVTTVSSHFETDGCKAGEAIPDVDS